MHKSLPRFALGTLALLAACAATLAEPGGSAVPARVAVLPAVTPAALPVTRAAENVGTLAVDLPRYPALSPDGSVVVFSWRGSLWRADVAGGRATRLTTRNADDLLPVFSDDGKRIAFLSTRGGQSNIWTMTPEGDDLRRVTDIDRSTVPESYVNTAAGPVITFTANLDPEFRGSPRSYSIPAAGGDMTPLFGAYGSQPAVSPDGSRILFTRGESTWSRRHYRGPDSRDLWLYDKKANTYTRLTTWAGNDGRGKWIDNDTFAYLSDRNGKTVQVYSRKVAAAEETAVQLTHFDHDVQAFDVARGGKRIVAHVWDRLYRVDLAAIAVPAPIALTAADDRADNETVRPIAANATEAAISPDGKVMAVIAFGQVYVRNTELRSPTVRVTLTPSRKLDLAWSPDGTRLYYTSDESGREAIYAATVRLSRSMVKDDFDKATKPRPATLPATAPATLPTSAPADAPASRPSRPRPKAITTTQFRAMLDAGLVRKVTAAGSVLVVQTKEKQPDHDNADLFAARVAPQGAEVPDALVAAIKAAGVEYVVAPRAGDATESASGPATSPSTRPTRDVAAEAKRWHDAIYFNTELVVGTDALERDASPSPDGKSLAFRRGNGQLVILDIESKKERVLVEGWSSALNWRWSPDSKTIAYVTEDKNYNDDIFLIPADGSKPPVNITRHPRNDNLPRFSADGKVLSFVSNRSNEEFQIFHVYLDKELEALSSKELSEYYSRAAVAAAARARLSGAADPGTARPSAPAAAPGGAPTAPTLPGGPRRRPTSIDPQDALDLAEPDAPASAPASVPATAPAEAPATRPAAYKDADLDDAWLRIRRITSNPGGIGSLEMSPAGDRFFFSANVGGEPGIYSTRYDGTGGITRIAASAPGAGISFQRLAPAGDAIVVVAGGSGALMRFTGELESFAISDSLRIDLAALSSQKFLEAARVVGTQFYSPTMNGTDWPKLTGLYHDLARRARTNDEWNYIAARFIGELNGSHLGITSREEAADRGSVDYGRLGTVHHRVENGFEVTSVMENTPAAKGPMALKPGDVITAVNLTPVGSKTLEQALKNTTGKETVLTVIRKIDGQPKEFSLLITPTSFADLGRIHYDNWRRAKAKLVAEWSGGQLGYIHIQGMDQGSLDTYERDLFAVTNGKKGLLIDVRNNGGGSTADKLLASIMVQPHAYTIARGMPADTRDGYPTDRLYITRSTLPMNMLCNEKSFSNAEIIAHAFKTLKRGTLVGQQTYGGVISTGGTTLVDGTTVRIPFRGWYLPNGTDMENNGAIPDLLVPSTPEDEAKEHDAQLKAAVDDLMKRVK